jgi:hypothetical protein
MAACNTRGYQSPLHMPPPPGCLPTRIEGFYDCHITILSPPTCVLPPQRVDPQEYIYHIMLNPVASTVPWQCVPLCPLAPVKSRVAQSQDSIASNVIQAHPLLPPPLPGHQTAPLICLSTFGKDAVVHYIPCNCLPPYIAVMLDCVHPTLLKYLVG